MYMCFPGGVEGCIATSILIETRTSLNYYTFWQVKSLYSVCIGAQDMCTCYWPPVKQEETYGKVQVKNLKETPKLHYILREFLVHHEEVRWCVVVCVLGCIVRSFLD